MKEEDNTKRTVRILKRTFDGRRSDDGDRRHINEKKCGEDLRQNIAEWRSSENGVWMLQEDNKNKKHYLT